MHHIPQIPGSRLSLMPFTESRHMESASGFHITGKLQCLRWMPIAEFPGIPLRYSPYSGERYPWQQELHTDTHTEGYVPPCI